MKLILLLITGFFSITSFGQNTGVLNNVPDPAKKLFITEVSCGECMLGLPGHDCDLAVRINKKAYFVDGAAIDAFGDAHASDGFCKAIRKAEVQGEIINNRFKISYIKLLPEVKKN